MTLHVRGQLLGDQYKVKGKANNKHNGNRILKGKIKKNLSGACMRAVSSGREAAGG